MKTFYDLGKQVKCSAYYKKVKDGVFIVCFDKNGYITDGANKRKIEEAVAVDTYGYEQALRFEGDGIDKTLYRLTDKTFTGVCVGKVIIPITEYLYCDTSYNIAGNEFKFVGKQVTKTCECYVIYYANNRKRYVPVEHCTFIDKEN